MPNKDEEIESLMKEIRSSHKDYGYRRMTQELRNRGIHINMKKVQRLMNKLGLQVTSYTRKSRKYSSYIGTVGIVAKKSISTMILALTLVFVLFFEELVQK